MDVLGLVIGPFVDILIDERVESLEVVSGRVFGAVVCFVESLEVVLGRVFGAVVCFVECGALVVRTRLLLTVLFVRVFFRLVKVVTLLRVGVTLGVFGFLTVTIAGVGEVKESVP